ncbi:MAG TPA: hypothetical protein VFF27_06095 [Bacteroidia bacterium]|jgi:hypothetical protein|nr:hypothetical protein [Bacteroidia bacterium]
MSTISQTHSVKTHLSISSTETKSLSKFWDNLEASRFGVIAILLVIVACIAGIAAADAVQRNTLLLLAVTLPAMAVETLILSVMSMRSIFIASAISVVISLLVIIF